jgi:catechol 2,3-dioxygenase-like lactoylglutathione lyase family enzyme
MTTTPTPLGAVVLYVRDVEACAAFYAKHFGFEVMREPGDRIVEPFGPGARLRLHPMAKGQKAGQVLAKLSFDVRDVEGFCAHARANGLAFGALHKGAGYVFANARDPNGNPVQVTSRAFRKQ